MNLFRRNRGGETPDIPEIETRDQALTDALVQRDIQNSLAGFGTSTGVVVTPDRVAGLPAVGRAISMVANDVAKQPLRVVDSTLPDAGLAETSWQWLLLHDKPNANISPFEFWRNATTSLVGHSNLFIEKVAGVGRFRTTVVELHLLDPCAMMVRRNNSGDLEYKYGSGDWMPASRVIHIRGFSPNPADIVAPSPIQLFRDTFAHGLAAKRYINSFYGNNATPSGIIQFPEDMNETQTREFMNLWNSQHQGVNNAHKTGVLGGGGVYNPIGVSPSDAEFVETMGLQVDDIARIFGVPSTRLDAHYQTRINPNDEDRYWETVQTYMTLIEEGLRADSDLFPSTVTLRPKFHFDALLRISPVQRSQIYTQARQGGWLSINEIRAKEGMPPIDPSIGDVYHPIPAGAGPDGMGNGSGTPPPPPADDTQETP